MRHVYLSPHLDDAVFSCGGLIARQAACGDRVDIVTIFAAAGVVVPSDPGALPVSGKSIPPGERDGEVSTSRDEGWISPLARGLVALWGSPADVGAARRAEDRAACARLGATPRHLPFVEAVFRLHDVVRGEGRRSCQQASYPTAAHLFGEPHASDRGLPGRIAADLATALAGADAIYCPAATGGHVDHRLARAAAEITGLPLTYYEEQPYAARGYPPGAPLPPRVPARVRFHAAELDLWADASWDYRIGAKPFWRSRDEIRVELAVAQDRAGGFAVWSADASTCSYTAR